MARVIKKTPLKIAFGNIVKARRVYLEFSQEKLAELADLNLSFVSQIERGYRDIGLETLYKLAKALNTHPGNLLP
ncbi:MAG: helix-turn-helix domain-containing protein [Candidatus Rhabdochlamydia sp.]